MFSRKQDAERFLVTVSADVLRGAYVDPDAGKVTFTAFAKRWLAAQTFPPSDPRFRRSGRSPLRCRSRA